MVPDSGSHERLTFIKSGAYNLIMPPHWSCLEARLLSRQHKSLNDYFLTFLPLNDFFGLFSEIIFCSIIGKQCL